MTLLYFTMSLQKKRWSNHLELSWLISVTGMIIATQASFGFSFCLPRQEANIKSQPSSRKSLKKVNEHGFDMVWWFWWLLVFLGRGERALLPRAVCLAARPLQAQRGLRVVRSAQPRRVYNSRCGTHFFRNMHTPLISLMVNNHPARCCLMAGWSKPGLNSLDGLIAPCAAEGGGEVCGEQPGQAVDLWWLVKLKQRV